MNTVTAEGFALIRRFESLRLAVYHDPIGIRTIGYGHVMVPGLDKFTTITEDQADALLARDVALRSTWVPHFIQVPLNDNQFSALVSLVFNVGVEPLAHTLGMLLNAADYDGAAEQFARWNRAGGRVMPGLVERRAAERELFEKPTEERLPWLKPAT